MAKGLRGPALRLLACLACWFLSNGDALAQDRSTATNRPPNILFVISDDVGLDVTTGMYPGLIDGLARKYGPSGLNHPGHQTITGTPASTPNLEQLAKQGMVFTNVWAQPFCSPTRASILTGLFAVKANVLSYADPLAQSYTSLVKTLKDEAGYSTGLFGKWHLAGLPGRPADYPGMKPKQAGFEVFKGNMHAAIRTYWDYDYQVQDATTPDDTWRTEKPPTKSLPGIAPTTYSDVVKIADALEWITTQEKSSPNKPWLAWVAFNLSHATSQQQPSAMAVPNADTLDPRAIAEIKACGGTFGTANTGRCTGETLMRVMTNSMDTLLGKLLSTVDSLDPNTFVIFVGDNGTPMYGRANLDFIDNMYITRKGRGKGTAYESGARVQLAVRGPGIKASTNSVEPVHVADLFSTMLSMAGLKVPERVSNRDGSGQLVVDGVSLTPILFDRAKTVRDPNRGVLLTESLNLMTNSTRQVGARNGTYKLVCTERVTSEACEFFNLANDPLEEYPLAKPDSCAAYAGWTTAEPRWHYCRLADAVANDSFLSPTWQGSKASPAPGGGRGAGPRGGGRGPGPGGPGAAPGAGRGPAPAPGGGPQ
jgi:arylsulfatase A-like enzyme